MQSVIRVSLRMVLKMAAFLLFVDGYIHVIFTNDMLEPTHRNNFCLLD